jgi:hypothetical protein
MKRLVLTSAMVFLFGCVASTPTLTSMLNGNPSEFAAPTCVHVQAQNGNLAVKASDLLAAALRRHGISLSQACPASASHVRVEVNASDTVVTTHGIMPGQISLEANLQVVRPGNPGARAWLLRTDAYYIKPEVNALADSVFFVLQHGALPSKGAWVR